MTEQFPKNIRQIKTPGNTNKVYVEDYVHTYLHGFIKEKYRQDTLRAAALFGTFQKTEDTTCAFIKGAIACDFSCLHQELQESLSGQARQYFPGWDMLGWYVSAQGMDGHIQSEIRHCYAREERKTPAYLIYEDELEKETEIYLWEQNSLQKLTGHYIYYEKNPRMQEFMIREKGGQPQEMPACYAKKEERELSSYIYKEETEQKQKKPKEATKPVAAVRTRLVYGACALVLVILAAMGIGQIGSYKDLQQLQTAMGNTVIIDDPIPEEVYVEEKEPVEEPVVEEESQPPAEVSEEANSLKEEISVAEEESVPEEEPVPEEPVAAAEAVRTYVVQKGDSLFSISRRVYENETMVDEICELNDITNIHMIYEGQTLKLP